MDVNYRVGMKTRYSLDRIRRWRTENGVASWLVVYPEGTRFDPEDEGKMRKSRDFAAGNDLKPLQVRGGKEYRRPRSREKCVIHVAEYVFEK